MHSCKNPVERVVEALSMAGALKARVAVLSDTAVGLLMFDYVWNDMNAFGPEMTICEVATERFLGRAATIGRQGKAPKRSSVR